MRECFLCQILLFCSASTYFWKNRGFVCFDIFQSCTLYFRYFSRDIELHLNIYIYYCCNETFNVVIQSSKTLNCHWHCILFTLKLSKNAVEKLHIYWRHNAQDTSNWESHRLND